MVFGVDPEDGDDRDAVLGADLVREAQRRQCLEQREERTTKQSRLLTSDDRDRARVPQQGRRGKCLRGRTSTLLLRANQAGHAIPLAPVPLGPGDGITPGGGVGRVAVEKLCQSTKVERVVGGQPPNPREPADIDSKFVLGGRRDWLGEHRRLLWQTVERSVKTTGALSVS